MEKIKTILSEYDFVDSYCVGSISDSKSFLTALILTVLKFEKDNELIVLWTSGLNKIHVVNLMLRISLLMMFVQLLMTTLVNPPNLNFSRILLKNSELQFVPSLLKEKQFNDTVEGLTIFVEKKHGNGTYENIFIRDDSKVLTKISSGSSTILAKAGYVMNDNKSLILLNGNIQKLESDGGISIVKFEKTSLNLSGLSTKTISETKIQETSTLKIARCVQGKIISTHNCDYKDEKMLKNSRIEMNRRFGIPIFIPLVALISCFLLAPRKEKKTSILHKYIYFFIGFAMLAASEISVRYSGTSWNHTAIYYLVPLGLLPILYFFLIRTFKYENLR